MLLWSSSSRLGIRRTCKYMTANDDNTDYRGSSARVNDCSNCVGIDKEKVGCVEMESVKRGGNEEATRLDPLDI